jgi:hypothetical protein
VALAFRCDPNAALNPLAQVLSTGVGDAQLLLSHQPAMLEQLAQAPLGDVGGLRLFLRQPHCTCCRNSSEIEGLPGAGNQFGSRLNPLLIHQVEHPVTELCLPEFIVMPGEREFEAG